MTEAPEKDNSFTELGKFVEAFEHMVDAVRTSCLFKLCNSGKWQPLINIVLHHQVMTAKPLMDVYRALHGHILADKATIKAMQLTEQQIATYNGVLRQINKEYIELANKRNELLHGTWHIGFEKDPTKFFVHKYKTSATGLVSAELPKNTDELRALRAKCEKVQGWVNRLSSTYGFNHDICQTFRYNEERGEWEMAFLGRAKTMPS